MFSKSIIIVKISVLNKAWLFLTEDKGGGWGQETRGSRDGLKPANSKINSRSSKNRRLTLRIYFKMFYVNETLWDHHWIRVHQQTRKNDYLFFFFFLFLKRFESGTKVRASQTSPGRFHRRTREPPMTGNARQQHQGKWMRLCTACVFDRRALRSHRKLGRSIWSCLSEHWVSAGKQTSSEHLC